MQSDWETDCLHWYGKILRGPDAHWCLEFDDLPINAWCSEYQACLCKKSMLGKMIGWAMKFYWNRKFQKYCNYEDLFNDQRL